MELDALLHSVGLSRVTTLEVALPGLGLGPAATTSVTRLVDRLPALKRLTLSFTGPFDSSHTSGAIGLHQRGRSRGIPVAVSVILDADASAFAALGRTPGSTPPTSLTSVLDASRRLRREGVSVHWIVPVVPPLVSRLEALFSLARDEGVDPVLEPASFVNPTGGQPDVGLDGDDRLFVSDFIRYRLLDEEALLHSSERIAFYRALEGALDGSGDAPPALVRRVAVLRAADTGPGLRWTLADEDRPHVGGLTDEPPAQRRNGSGSRRLGRLRGPVAGAAEVLRESRLALTQWLRAGTRGWAPARPPQAGRRFSRVLLIGAYGGEHIGDAAILGGVLFRLNRRYGTTEGTLMSQRPRHTRHLVPMLDTPFKIDVEAYEPAMIREHLRRAEAVVFAGGPLIDLPRQLVKHLYTVSLARRSGKPFIMEGIGPGPFPRRPSEWTARQIVRMAERISVRTSTDANHRLMKGLPVEVGRDPAFDYLATRGPELTRQRELDRQWIERLLRDTDGRPLIGVNLRPIRHLFTVGVAVGQRAEYTRLVETRFEAALAEGMRRFHLARAAAPCFVFFPMNAIQFGMSDLRSAYRLQRALGPDVDFRVWEADASLDGVVALLRRLDIVISMRFHATIFALAQRRRVIGIDYRVGERDKVGALLDDFGQSENCSRIDEMTSDWLFQRLSALARDTLDGRNPVRE